MTELTAWLKALGKDADKLNVVFITVDPERDTPAQLREYLSNFDPRIQGFTGTPEAIAKTARAYRVYYQKVPQDGGGYTIDHSSAIYLFDAKGRFVSPIAYQSPPERALAQLRDLVN
jgi:protein SCO1/2